MNENSQNIRLTAVIGNHSKAARVVENIEYLLRQETNFEFKILVSDVSCSSEQVKILKDGLTKHPNVELIINPTNLGYTRSHNQIKGKEAGQYIFIINPDILFREKDTIQKSVEYMDAHPDIAILGPQQVNDNGEIAMTVRAFPKFYLQVVRRTFLRHLPFLKKKVAYDEMKHLDYSKIQDVDWLQSSCVVIRRDFWERVGGYNEYYFLFMGDTEMCLEAWKRGCRVVYYPETRVYADGKRLSAGGFLKFFQSWFIRQHVIDSLKYRLKNLWSGNPRENYYQSKNRNA